MKKIFGIIKGVIFKCWLRCINNETYIKYLRKHGIKIGRNVRFRYPEHTLIDLNRPTLIEFGSNIDVNDNFTLLTHDFGTFVIRGKYKDFINSSGKVKIGSNVVFGRDVTILKGVEIGDNTIVALGSVVTKSTPPNSVIAGSPARVISSLDDYYKKRKERSVQEALEYAVSIKEKKGRLPRIDEMYEEWVLFLTQEDYDNHPEIKPHVDYRLKGYMDKEDFLQRQKVFNGFDNFLHAVEEYDHRNI